MTRQAVARPARDDAQCRVRLDDGTGHLVHRTVSPYSHHDVRTLVFGLLCNDRGMAAILGVNDFIVKQILVELRLDDLPDARFLHCARNGIDDEYDMYMAELAADNKYLFHIYSYPHQLVLLWTKFKK